MIFIWSFAKHYSQVVLVTFKNAKMMFETFLKRSNFRFCFHTAFLFLKGQLKTFCVYVKSRYTSVHFSPATALAWNGDESILSCRSVRVLTLLNIRLYGMYLCNLSTDSILLLHMGRKYIGAMKRGLFFLKIEKNETSLKKCLFLIWICNIHEFVSLK